MSSVSLVLGFFFLLCLLFFTKMSFKKLILHFPTAHNGSVKVSSKCEELGTS